MLGIAIHCIQHSKAILERGVCELAHSFFHLHQCLLNLFLNHRGKGSISPNQHYFFVLKSSRFVFRALFLPKSNKNIRHWSLGNFKVSAICWSVYSPFLNNAIIFLAGFFTEKFRLIDWRAVGRLCGRRPQLR